MGHNAAAGRLENVHHQHQELHDSIRTRKTIISSLITPAITRISSLVVHKCIKYIQY